MVTGTKKKKKVSAAEIVNGVGAGLSLISRNMRIIWANPIIEKWFIGNKGICGRHCYEVYRHSNKICPNCPTKKVFKTGRMHKSIQRGFTAKGERRLYLLIVAPIKDNRGNTIQALELVQDVTRKKKEEVKKAKLVNDLKNMCSRLMKANKRLKKNTGNLKRMTDRVRQLNSKWESRYKKLTKELDFTKEELKDVFEVSQSISSCTNLKKTLSLIVKLTTQIVHADACALRLVGQSNKTLVPEVSLGLSKGYLSQTPLKIGEGVAGSVAKTGKPISVYDVAKDGRVRYAKIVTKEGVMSVLGVPAIFDDKVLGVITIYSKNARRFNDNEIKLLMTFASQTAVAIQEAKLYRDVHLTYFNTIHALVLAMEARDPYTRGHSDRVTQYAIKTASRLMLPQEQINVLRYAGRVHDVGKIGISDIILNKPGKLTLAERAIIELHPTKGAEMLEPLKFLEPGLPIVRHHHERFDGAGYPDRLKKTEIPITARILACADAFDAMTSERPYRARKLTLDEAIKELKVNSGTQFDPGIIPTFIQVLKLT